MKILIKGGRVINPATNMDDIADVLVEDGKVVAIEKYDLFGNTVIVDHGLGLQTWYFGISDISVSLGDYILQGETLGRSGICELSSSDGFIFMVTVNGSIIDPQLFFDHQNFKS